MPVLLLWKSICRSSAEKDEPPTRVVSMNCSMVYCRTARAEDFAAVLDSCARAGTAASAVSANSAASATRDDTRGDFSF
jgi:hypothetical protein